MDRAEIVIRDMLNEHAGRSLAKYKKSLPSEEEILAIIDDITLDGGINPEMAKAIYKRIHRR